MTLDRDIRFTLGQITVTQHALRDEIKRRIRSIATAEASRQAGGTIQYGRLAEHYRALNAAREALENLEVARRAIERQVTEKLDTAR